MSAPIVEAPIGAVLAFAGNDEDLPLRDQRWMLCNGRSLKIRDFIELFSVIGWIYGLGDDPVNRTTFELPDYQGYFLRGMSGETENDPDRKDRREHFDSNQIAGNRVGSVQKDAIQSHGHNADKHRHNLVGWGVMNDATGEGDNQVLRTGFGGNTETNDITVRVTEPSGQGVRVATETRPKNVSVHWIIRVK